MKAPLFLSVLALLALANPRASATAGAVDPTFATGPAGIAINRIAVQSSGHVVIAGNMSAYAGTPTTGLVRLRSDGTVDADFHTSLGSGFEGPTVVVPGVFTNVSPAQFNALIPTSAGLLVGGSFVKVNGTSQPNLVRLRNAPAAGTSAVDAAFAGRPDNTVLSIALQNDGRILVGGAFKNMNGTARDSLARLNADGSLDASFKPVWTPLIGASARSLLVQPDGRILVGGTHLALSPGVTPKGLVRLNADGSPDTSFHIPTLQFLTESVNAMVLQGDGRIVIAGSFAKIDGAVHRGIARLNADGTLDPTWPGTGIGTLGLESLTALVAGPQGRMYAGGHFDTLNGSGPSGIARLNADGSRDATFQKPAGSTTFWVDGLAVQTDGKVLVGGSFTLGNTADSGRSVLRLTAEDSVVVPPPTITTQPASVAWILDEAGRSLGVQAAGSPPLSYQWYKDGTLLGSKTEPTLAFPQVTEATAGRYTVVVTNPGGSTTSVEAVVGVLVPARVSTQPRSLVVNEGGSASFSVDVTGTPPITYQWKKNGVDLPGATSATLTLPAATLADAGPYSVAVANAAGGDLSQSATLTVVAAPPVVTVQPVSQIVSLPENRLTAASLVGRRLHLVVAGALPPWIDHGAYDITFEAAGYASPAGGALATGSRGSFTVGYGSAPPATLIDFGTFFPTDEPATLTLLPNGIYEFNRANLVADQNGRWELIPAFTPPAGTNLTLTVAATGTPPITYQWRHDGIPMPGRTGATLVLTNIQSADLGEYTAIVTNPGGSVLSEVAFVSSAATPTGVALTTPRWVSGSLQFGVPTTAGKTYEVQTSAALGAPNWTVARTLHGDGTTQSVTVPATAAAGFVRIREN